MRNLFSVGVIVGAIAGCKEPMSDDPGYRAQVLCNNTMKGQGGAKNESKVRCVSLVGDKFRAEPKGSYETLAKCILNAADDAAARECK